MAEEIKGKRTRTQVKRPSFMVFQVLDENGQPMAFPKERINVILSTTDAAKALEVMDGGEHIHATYKKVPAS